MVIGIDDCDEWIIKSNERESVRERERGFTCNGMGVLIRRSVGACCQVK